MSKKGYLFLLFSIVFGVLLLSRGNKVYAGTPIVGAIRWDAWFSPTNSYEANLDPPEWHYRWPTFSYVDSTGHVKIQEDKQEIIDSEIALAKNAGLDYWAFLYFNQKWDSDFYNYGVNTYLKSTRKNDIDFCLIFSSNYQGTWEIDLVPQLITKMKEPTYQKVLGGRPLLYIFDVPSFVPKKFGTTAEFATAIASLRSEAIKAGVGDPYIVGMYFQVSQAGSSRTLKLDAISAYDPNNTTGLTAKEYPYSTLATQNLTFWNQAKNGGYKVVPTVSAGFDDRPRHSPPYAKPWFAQGTPTEIASNVAAAINWTTANPTANPTDLILIYAWNEIDEGGWLVPTLSEGNQRLTAIGQVLNQTQAVTGDTNDDGTVNATDLKAILTNYLKTVSTSLNQYGQDSKINVLDFVMVLKSLN